MTNMQRVKRAVGSLVMIFLSFIIFKYPSEGFLAAAVIVSVSLLLYGARTLLYYLTMARHMVGGRSILYIGIIVFDLGIFIFSAVEDPKLFVVIYLLGIHAFSGVMSVMRALEARRFASPSWKWILIDGAANTAVAVLAVIAGLFLRSEADLAFLFAACLLYSACVQLSTVFQKTAIIYIQ